MSVRAMLARVQRLERERAPVASPFARAFGSFAAFEAECEAKMAAGRLDPRDFREVLQCLAGWERNGVFGLWQRDRVWSKGAR